MKIPYAKPSITQLEIDYVNDAVTNGWGEHRNSYIDRFERQFAEHLGVKYAIATSSCTGALHMGLSALGIGLGDEVILADTNWVATAAPIVYIGAQPVFVDIRQDSWCINPELIESAITKNTKAIIATHLYGNLANMSEILDVGQRYGLPVIEDAAEAIGSKYFGHRAGSLGLFGVFSFHGSKTISTGEGGMFVTNDADHYERVLTLSNHGREKSETRMFWPAVVGFKYKMSNIQAAMGCAQLLRIDELVSKRQETLASYKKGLIPLGNVSMNPEQNGCENGAWMPNLVVSTNTGIEYKDLLFACRESGIDARAFFWSMSSLPMFKTDLNMTISRSVSSRAINLPSFFDISLEQINHVIQTIRRLVDRRGS
jgi:perosamine synthetase